MLNKISLIDELKKGGYEASLITTYNAYLPFYEEVVLRRLANAGVRHNALLMDAQQYAASLISHPPRLAGRQYTLLPVSVPGAFHPKLIFLAGKSKGAILVGSHNMTLAGFGFNREITNLVQIREKDTAGINLAQDVWKEIEFWLNDFTVGVPDHVRSMIRRVKEFAPWLNGSPSADPKIRLLAGRPGGTPLWQQFTGLLDGETSQFSAGGAFFDQELSFLKRVKRDLQPGRITVAVDPKTVQMPVQAQALEGMTFVQAGRIGCDEKSDEPYLHAKFVLAQQKEGMSVFASGSANPSRPAWLADDAGGNVELMLARIGDDALKTANSLGCSDIHTFPTLTQKNWEEISINQTQWEKAPATGIRSGVALAEATRILFDLDLLKGFRDLTFAIIAADGSAISNSVDVAVEDRFAVLNFATNDIEKAIALQGFDASKLALNLALHHAGIVEEQARSGTQRRLRDALASLDTDSPDISLLIQCIDKIVFDEDDPAAAAQPAKRAGSRNSQQPTGPDSVATLEIDVSEMRKGGKRQRLNHSSDFAYLLDALIYHLRLHQDKSREELDRFGRTEEEQIGADDDPDAEVALTPDKQAELLVACHSKVRTVVNRMISQMKAYAEGKVALTKILIRLLGVLAVLRELRSCDGRAAWIEKGKTAVPKDQRLRLLEAVMLNIFEREPSTSSLLSLEALGEEFSESDDVARLKGLLLWLAWDCGLTLNLHKPFRESPEAWEQRLKRNAMIVALAQVILSDETVIDEARESIGSFTAGELDWLRDIRRLADSFATLRADKGALRRGELAEAGDIAFHKTAEDWIVRMVAGRNGGKISLVALKENRPRLTYLADHLAVASLSSV
ncbi:hypothetical protein LQG66_27985 [Bradyrhizobium ontarionense]|uniref:Phospholipase D-like domain-containing protein n=1 Tax=Bradyrhizobium ontarionense TaxID=2898149 RepID=A0ABY3R7Q8_9BRAD|nr:hypothetical protein [Bradyrhizobium sp. A19]UFZ03057.1 hypothetical protein LQG66_27985 [Bradyrhizobium sp. A19]